MTHLDRYRSDWWAASLIAERTGNPRAVPRGVKRPTTTDEVAEILMRAAADRCPVVAWGAGSGVCGAAEPGSNALIIDMSAMSRVLAVDPESLVFTSQAGIMGPALEAELAQHGMTLGHVPQSFHFSTLGGWIATKGTGQFSTLYGGIEERLLAVEAVLADGSVVRSKASPRSSAGPDWWRMFMGAEGTLGIITDATLSAFPVTTLARWQCFEPASFDQGLDLLRRMMHAGIRPAVARLYDGSDAAVNFGGSFTSLLIIRFEGNFAEPQAAMLLELAGDIPVSDSAMGEHWWLHRFDAAEAYRTILSGDGPLGRHAVVDTMEVAAFWRELPSLYRVVRRALQDVGVMVLAHASHLYMSGGALYFTFLSGDCTSDEEAETLYHRAWDAGMRAALSVGATISHHHGIGLLKAPWMAEEAGTGMRVLRDLKTTFDPQMIMNPGKLGL